MTIAYLLLDFPQENPYPKIKLEVNLNIILDYGSLKVSNTENDPILFEL